MSKINKKLLLIMAIVCIFIIIPSSFASDLNNDTLTDTVDADENSIYVSESGNDTSGDGSEGNPYKSISKATESFDSTINSNIYVKNGNYEFSNQVTINKDLTIVGESSEGVVFDGKNITALFKIDSGNVQLNSLSFINANGGAIDVSSAKHFIVDNCIFEDNFGGAINSRADSYWESSSTQIEVKNSKFINNNKESWDAYGGALSVNGIYVYLNMTNCLFVNNSVTNGGGAVSINSNRKESFITKCEFINNTAKEGSAIYFSNAFDATIKNSIFVGNNASVEDSGVIDYTGSYYQRTLSVGGNTFKDNTPAKEYNIDDKISIVDLNNNDKLYGENIDHMDVGDDVYFTVTLTDGDGNPISGKLITFNLTDFFKKVSTYTAKTNDNGQASISLMNQAAGTYTVVSSFSGDETWDSVSTLNTVKIKSEHSNNIVFNESIVKVKAGDSYIVSAYVCDEYISYITPAFSTYNIAWKTHSGGTRYTTNGQITSGRFTVDVLDFDLSTQADYYYINFTSTNENGNTAYGTLIVDTSIPLPPVDENIEVIYVDQKRGSDEIGDGSEANPLATVQVALYLNELFGGNKTIFVKEGVYNISNYEIYGDVNIIGEKSKTIFRQHTGDDGMLYLDNGDVTKFTNITFMDGDAGTYSLYNAVIVVRYSGAVAYFDGCEFYNNKASSDGMMYVANQAVAYINNCIFAHNVARTFNPAGAIHVQDAYLSVNNSYFYNNTATEGAGIFVGGDSYALIQNSMFYKNIALNDTSALSGGGAIFVNNWNTHIYNCSFIENYAELNGGAIYILTGEVEIEKSVFINNRVKQSGSGIGTAIACDSGYTVKLYVKDSILYDDGYSNLIHITPDYDNMNEVILNDNYWGSDSKPVNANTYVIIKASSNKEEIKEGDLVEITVKFIGNAKELEESVHDYTLNLTTVLGQCDVDSITIVDNVVKFNYIASKAGNETISFTNGNVRYEFKFNVEESSLREAVNANITVNDDKNLITVQLPDDLTKNVTIIVDNVKYSIASNNGVAELPINLLPGDHTAYLTYEGDDKYKAEITDKFIFNVGKLNPALKINIENVVIGEDIVVEINANTNLNGSVIVIVNNKNYTVKVTNGIGRIQIDGLGEGTYSAKAILSETNYFFGDEANCEFNVTYLEINEIHVSQVRGSDAIGNGSYENPYATISKALDRNNRLGGNKTVVIEEGSYVLNRFSITKDVTIKAEGNVVIAPSTNTNHLYIGGNVKVNLEGLTFINGNGVTAGVIDMGSDDAGNLGKELTIKNCTFINNKGLIGVISTYADTKIISSSFINNTATGTSGFNQGIISVQANTIDLKYNIFLNNQYNDNIIVSRVNGLANDNFWGNNNKPSDVSDNLEIKTWVCVVPSIGADVRTKTNYDLYVEFKNTNNSIDYNDLEGKLQDLSFNIEAGNGLINPQSVVISNNIGIVNYNVSKKGDEEVRVYLYGYNIAKINFFVDVPEYDKIYVAKNGNATGTGSSDNPLSTLEQALAQNKATGGDKTIIIKEGTYDEHDLIIDANVVIIGENAIINGENNNIFTINANANISNLGFINAKTAIDHVSGELNILNASFNNNEKAIVSADKLNIKESKFTENTNAAVEANGETFIENSIFDFDIVKSTNNIIIAESRFNGGKINVVSGEATIKDNHFTSSGEAIIASGNVEISNNDLNGNSISLSSANAKLTGNKNTTISIENSNITNTVVSFLNGETVFVNNGTVQLNATVCDDMGNIINGGKVIFKSNNDIIGEANVENGIATLNYGFTKGNHTISGSFDSDTNAKVNSGLLRVDVDFYWYINDVGYETLADAIAAANLGDVIKGVPGTYKVSKLPIGHRYFSLEPWEVIKSVTITSLTDEPVTLEGSGVQMFFVDIGSELTLKNIIITGSGSTDDDGGAVEIMYNTNLTVINCTFTDNTASGGGAIYSLGGNLIVRDCVFDNNFAMVGGAIQIINYRSEITTIDNCKFTNNFAFFGGALYSGGAYIEIDRSLFFNNVANVGGALMMRDGGKVTVDNTDFISNTASSEEKNFTTQGGAIHNYLADLYLTNVKFIDNAADKGGALELENGLYGTVSWTTLDNCTFINNTAKKGGAIYMGDHFDPYVNITDCTFESNVASSGSLIAALYSHVNVKNTDFINNKATYIFEVVGEYISGEGFSPDQIFYGELTIDNSNFKGNDAMYDISANNYGIVKVSNSIFDGENSIMLNNGDATFINNKATNTNMNVIGNEGNLSLSNNEFDTPILNKKSISTPTYVIVLDNETKAVAMGEKYLLKAIVCDDNGNIIESGNLQFVINSDNIQSIYNNQVYVANFTVVGGTYVVGAIYDDAGLLDLTVKTGTIIVKKSSNLDATTEDILVGQEASIDVTVNPKATGNVTIVIDGKKYNSTVKNGFVNFKVSGLEYGEYSVEVNYLGDEEYAPSQKIIKLAVSKHDTYDFSFDINKIDAENAEIVVNLPTDATGNVTVVVNGKTYNTTVSEGSAVVNVDNMIIGENDISITYSGDHQYDSITQTTTFDGIKKASYVQINAKDIKFGQDAVIEIFVPSDADGQLIVTIDGKDQLETIYGGKAILVLSDLVIGTHTITADYVGNALYNGSTATTSFKVTGEVKNTYIALTIVNTEITGVLRYSDGSDVPNEIVYYSFDGKEYTTTTDSFGKFSVKGISGKEITFNFKGNEVAGQSMAIVMVKDSSSSGSSSTPAVTTKKKVTIKASAKKFKAKTKVKKYTITLKSSGKAVKNVKVTLKIKGKTYKAKTNAKGKATFKIKKLTKKGKYTAKIIFAGNKSYKAANKNAKITIKK